MHRVVSDFWNLFERCDYYLRAKCGYYLKVLRLTWISGNPSLYQVTLGAGVPETEHSKTVWPCSRACTIFGGIFRMLRNPGFDPSDPSDPPDRSERLC